MQNWSESQRSKHLPDVPDLAQMGCGSSTALPLTTFERPPMHRAERQEPVACAPATAFVIRDDCCLPISPVKQIEEMVASMMSPSAADWQVLDAEASSIPATPSKSVSQSPPGEPNPRNLRPSPSGRVIAPPPIDIPLPSATLRNALPPMGLARPLGPTLPTLGNSAPSAPSLKALTGADGIAPPPALDNVVRPLQPLGNLTNVCASNGASADSVSRKKLPALTSARASPLGPLPNLLVGRANWRPPAAPSPASLHEAEAEISPTDTQVTSFHASPAVSPVVRPVPAVPAGAPTDAAKECSEKPAPQRRLSWSEADPVVIDVERTVTSPVVDYRLNMAALQELRRQRELEGKGSGTFRSLVAELDMKEGGEALSYLSVPALPLGGGAAPAAPAASVNDTFTWGQMLRTRAVVASA